MCLIIDANVVHKVFPEPHQDFEPVHRALVSRRARLAYGGELRREYVQIGWFRRLLLRLDQMGSARKVPDSPVDAETERLATGRLCRSDDPHVIALARVGRVRLLCSDDADLCLDFRDPALISGPRGNIYRRREHADLLRAHCEPGVPADG
jgi:hypothetical protein